jgi:hypothetical protein
MLTIKAGWRDNAFVRFVVGDEIDPSVTRVFVCQVPRDTMRWLCQGNLSVRNHRWEIDPV